MPDKPRLADIALLALAACPGKVSTLVPDVFDELQVDLRTVNDNAAP